MQKAKPVGRGAASRKYDILTALGTFALGLGKTEQRRILRFITLMTARYNWAYDDLSVGQREIAMMWSCDERTVKREMAWFRGQGWLHVRIQGVRGRVTSYRLGLDNIWADTQNDWRKVGPDFETRMSITNGDEAPNVVKLTPKTPVPAPDVSVGTEWSLAQAILYQEDAAKFAAWFAALERHDRIGGRLMLKAPSKFHAAYVLTHHTANVLRACKSVDDSVNDVSIIV